VIKLKNIKIILFYLFCIHWSKNFWTLYYIIFNWIYSNTHVQHAEWQINNKDKNSFVGTMYMKLNMCVPILSDFLPCRFFPLILPSIHFCTSLSQAEEPRRRREGGCERAEKIGNRCEIALAGCMPGSQDYLRRVITARCESMAVGRPGKSITANGHKIPRCGMRVKRIHAQLCVISYYSMMWHVYGTYVHSEVETSACRREYNRRVSSSSKYRIRRADCKYINVNPALAFGEPVFFM